MKTTTNMSDVGITLGNKGIMRHIADPQGKHVGDLRLGRSTGEWMKGKTREGNGVRFQITKLIEMLEELGAAR